MKLTTTTGKRVDVILKSPELRDKWVKLMRPINNAIHQMDAGAFMQIRSYGGGLGKFTLITPTCPHCGVASFISHVSQNSFELHADVDAAGKLVWLTPADVPLPKPQVIPDKIKA